jgi:hypothetical protein
MIQPQVEILTLGKKQRMSGCRYTVGGKTGDAVSLRHSTNPYHSQWTAHSGESGQVKTHRLYLGACCADTLSEGRQVTQCH